MTHVQITTGVMGNRVSITKHYIFRHICYVALTEYLWTKQIGSINIISEMEFHYEMVLLLRMKYDSLD